MSPKIAITISRRTMSDKLMIKMIEMGVKPVNISGSSFFGHHTIFPGKKQSLQLKVRSGIIKSGF